MHVISLFSRTTVTTQTIIRTFTKDLLTFEKQCKPIRCEVRIEQSVTRVTFLHHESTPSDGNSYSYRTTMMDFFFLHTLSCTELLA